MWTKGAVSIFMFLFFFLMIRRPPRSTLFPYPPLSRSPRAEGVGAEPPPQGAAADFAYDALRDNLTLDFGEGQPGQRQSRSEEHTSELQSQSNLVCRLLLEKKKTTSESRVVATLTSIFT